MLWRQNARVAAVVPVERGGTVNLPDGRIGASTVPRTDQAPQLIFAANRQLRARGIKDHQA